MESTELLLNTFEQEPKNDEVKSFWEALKSQYSGMKKVSVAPQLPCTTFGFDRTSVSNLPVQSIDNIRLQSQLP